MIVWVLVCLFASWQTLLIVKTFYGTVEVFSLLYFSLLSIMQYLVIYQFLQVDIRLWVPLSVAGALAGPVLNRALSFGSAIDPFPYLVPAVGYLMIWGLPALFHWVPLRARFRYHGLWLLAAVVMGPLGAFFVGMDARAGIFAQAVATFSRLTSSNSIFLQFNAVAADFAMPSIILGLVLYAVVSQGGKATPMENTDR